MRIGEQLQQRRATLGKTLQSIADLTAMSLPQVSNVMTGKVDSRISTVEALADAMDATYVLVPKHLLPEIQRLLSGKAIGPDDVPTAAERILAAK
ncbi:helix-turn-helix domain-containing protein [Herbaspirillum chlorophenolicum]|uniref:helix-turn-helix domain-containing protein n=1 Tax=Herbaspirillum chlorophenolicum TaxID=211589 RepID=UPI00067E6077|nr:helix-turn-helix transcriptional regulator [Herbaspirillum chlorophenolicum]